jgi:hypothetical protein
MPCLLGLLLLLVGCGTDPGAACDEDHDGFESIQCGGMDCDDTRADVHPGADDTWVRQIVDPELPSKDLSTVSLATSPQGGMHLVYRARDGSLRHVTNRTGTWIVDTIDAEPSRSTYSSLAIDVAGGLHVAYAGGYDHHYAIETGEGWLVQLIEDATITWTRLALDESGHAHIAYQVAGAQNLRYTSNASGSWTSELVDAASIGGQSLVLDGAGHAHVSYGGAGGLQYATNKSGTWANEVVDARGGGSSIAIDSEGDLHIVYTTASGELLLASGVSSAWTVESLDDAGASRPLLVVDAADQRHIAYGDESSLVYLAQNGAAWSRSIVCAECAPDALTVDDVGVPWVTYRDSSLAARVLASPAPPDGVDNDCDGVIW